MVRWLERRRLNQKDLLNFITGSEWAIWREQSMIEMAVRLLQISHFDVMNPCCDERDPLRIEQSHCSETLYTIFSDLGAYTMDYMFSTSRR
jgi:transketolase